MRLPSSFQHGLLRLASLLARWVDAMLADTFLPLAVWDGSESSGSDTQEPTCAVGGSFAQPTTSANTHSTSVSVRWDYDG